MIINVYDLALHSHAFNVQPGDHGQRLSILSHVPRPLLLLNIPGEVYRYI